MMSATNELIFRRTFQLGEIERQAVLRTLSVRHSFASDRDFLSAGTLLSGIHIILSGVACRYLTLQSGQRQIMSFLLPGDLCDIRGCFTQKIDCFVRTLSEVHTVTISRPDLMMLSNRFPQFMQELWRLMSTEDATTRQWLLNVGRRSAIQRLSHLLCECFVRLRAAGLVNGNSCSLPMTQSDIADALALTPVHVNRTLMELRNAGVAAFKNHQLTLLDPPALYAVAEFEPDYLGINMDPIEVPCVLPVGLAREWRPRHHLQPSIAPLQDDAGPGREPRG